MPGNQLILSTGMGKSAADMAVLCGEFAKESKMIFRRAHWMVPRFLLGLVSTRFGFFAKYPIKKCCTLF